MTTRDLDRIRFVTEHFTELQGLRWVPLGMVLVLQGLSAFLPIWPRPIGILLFALFTGMCAMFFWVTSYYRSFGEVRPRPVVLGPESSALSIYRPAGPAPALAVERQPMNVMWLMPLSLLVVVLVFLLRAVLPSALILPDGSGVDPWAQFHPPVVEVLAEHKPMLPRSLSEPGSFSELLSLLDQGMYAFLGAYFLSSWFQRGRRLSQGYHLVLGSLLLGLALLGSCLGLFLKEMWSLGMVDIPPQSSRVLLPLAHHWMAMMLCGISVILAGLLDHLQLVRVLKPVKEVEA